MKYKNEPNEEALRQIADGAILLPYSISKLNDLICGCGSPRIVWEWVMEYLVRLREAKEDGDVVSMDPTTAGDWMLLYAVDYARMTEHGIGVRCGWITQEGLEALEFLRLYGPQWESERFFVNADGVCCGVL